MSDREILTYAIRSLWFDGFTQSEIARGLGIARGRVRYALQKR
jgi:DNA-binding transcriptional regulator LsrR (DeoR family)